MLQEKIKRKGILRDLPYKEVVENFSLSLNLIATDNFQMRKHHMYFVSSLQLAKIFLFNQEHDENVKCLHLAYLSYLYKDNFFLLLLSQYLT